MSLKSPSVNQLAPICFQRRQWKKYLRGLWPQSTPTDSGCLLLRWGQWNNRQNRMARPRPSPKLRKTPKPKKTRRVRILVMNPIPHALNIRKQSRTSSSRIFVCRKPIWIKHVFEYLHYMFLDPNHLQRYYSGQWLELRMREEHGDLGQKWMNTMLSPEKLHTRIQMTA